MPGSQRIETGQQAGPLQPLAEAQPGFALELPGQGASADTQPLGASLQAPVVRRPTAYGPAQLGQRRIDRQRDVQREDRQHAQLIQDQLHDPFVPTAGRIVVRDPHGGDDQLAQ